MTIGSKVGELELEITVLRGERNRFSDEAQKERQISQDLESNLNQLRIQLQTSHLESDDLKNSVAQMNHIKEENYRLQNTDQELRRARQQLQEEEDQLRRVRDQMAE